MSTEVIAAGLLASLTSVCVALLWFTRCSAQAARTGHARQRALDKRSLTSRIDLNKLDTLESQTELLTTPARDLVTVAVFSSGEEVAGNEAEQITRQLSLHGIHASYLTTFPLGSSSRDSRRQYRVLVPAHQIDRAQALLFDTEAHTGLS